MKPHPPLVIRILSSSSSQANATVRDSFTSSQKEHRKNCNMSCGGCIQDVGGNSPKYFFSVSIVKQCLVLRDNVLVSYCCGCCLWETNLTSVLHSHPDWSMRMFSLPKSVTLASAQKIKPSLFLVFAFCKKIIMPNKHCEKQGLNFSLESEHSRIIKHPEFSFVQLFPLTAENVLGQL